MIGARLMAAGGAVVYGVAFATGYLLARFRYRGVPDAPEPHRASLLVGTTPDDALHYSDRIPNNWHFIYATATPGVVLGLPVDSIYVTAAARVESDALVRSIIRQAGYEHATVWDIRDDDGVFVLR